MYMHFFTHTQMHTNMCLHWNKQHQSKCMNRHTRWWWCCEHKDTRNYTTKWTEGYLLPQKGRHSSFIAWIWCLLYIINLGSDSRLQIPRDGNGLRTEYCSGISNVCQQLLAHVPHQLTLLYLCGQPRSELSTQSICIHIIDITHTTMELSMLFLTP